MLPSMTTPVYIKMDAHDQLLLSEGVCRQLGILHYHPSVERWRGGKRKYPPLIARNASRGTPPDNTSTPPAEQPPDDTEGAVVPTVRVNLLQSTHLLPHQSGCSRCRQGQRRVILLRALTVSNSTVGCTRQARVRCGIQPDGTTVEPPITDTPNSGHSPNNGRQSTAIPVDAIHLQPEFRTTDKSRSPNDTFL